MNRLIITSTLLIASLTTAHADIADTTKIYQLEDVNVVATLKEHGGIRQQAAATTTVSRQQLESGHVTSLKGAAPLVPNLFMPDYGSRLTSAVYIRGVGSRVNTPAVGLYVDNIQCIDKSAYDFNLYDIERIDVLRGPQATLYGRNAMGGLIRVYTRNPLYYQGTEAKLSYATGDNHRSVSLTHYHRPSDKFAFSAGGYYEGSDGFFRNDRTGEKVDAMDGGGGRMRGIFMPNNRLSFDLTLSYDYNHEGAYPYYYTGSLNGKEEYADAIGHITNNRENTYRRSLFNAGLNIGYTAPAWQLNAVIGYQNLSDRMYLDQDFMYPDIYSLEQRQRINTLTAEVTAKSRREGMWQWVSGVNFMRQWLHTDGPVEFYSDGMRWLENGINSNMPDLSNVPMMGKMGFGKMSITFNDETLPMDGSYETPTYGLALFHQSTFNITEQLSLSAGLRIDYEKESLKYNTPVSLSYAFNMPNQYNPAMSISLPKLLTDMQYEGKLSDDHLRLLPKIALRHSFDKYNNVYLSAAMGQRSGGYNLQMFSDLMQGYMRIDMMDKVKGGIMDYLDALAQRVPQMAAIKPMVEKTLEENMPKYEEPSTGQVTYKPEYSLNYELGCHLSFLDHRLQADAAAFLMYVYDQQIARFAPTGLGRMMVNAGRSRSYGLEASLIFEATPRLTLAANYGFTHSTFSDYAVSDDTDYSGNYVPFVPQHTLSADAAYRIPLSCPWAKSLTLSANTTAAGKIYWTEANDVCQPFYATLGAAATLEMKHLTLRLWGKNLTDTKYNTFYFESAARGYEQHAKPLQIGIDINLHI